METQNAQILHYLKQGKTISPLEALNMFGCFRLAGRIFELREDGWPIHCDRREVGGGRRVGFYSLDTDRTTWPQ